MTQLFLYQKSLEKSFRPVIIVYRKKPFNELQNKNGEAEVIRLLPSLILLTVLLFGNSILHAEDDDKVSIKIGEKMLNIAYADSPLERQLGLMYRKKMCEDCGMLFKFERSKIAGIWMKNTYIPLDLAYITKDGIIVDIKPLTPHDLVAVNSPEPVLYALEMNQGWFDKQNIRVGDKVDLLP
ncbi:DUF192 domain-containing protein [Glaciecola petra]|uniref:DUF192 domain-containing protein n=1 Tax=Glaciecola petra TaxID=3075602 RepID=A0ABU2ZVD2_9ALTE|nr:DUF192 domain-containing protein [Aestuariibacter sp. P117]MDT0596611.1 DUF192 domain-containing protein [Aestuariibacter sp. P117]